jgi:hypothetical protein
LDLDSHWSGSTASPVSKSGVGGRGSEITGHGCQSVFTGAGARRGACWTASKMQRETLSKQSRDRQRADRSLTVAAQSARNMRAAHLFSRAWVRHRPMSYCFTNAALVREHGS